MGISTADIELLRQESSVESRVHVTRKIAQDFNSGVYSATEAAVAMDIFRLLARDAQNRVRRAVAEELARSMQLPRELALQFAQDQDSIAVPVLEQSYALREDDLLAIIRSTRSVLKWNAIARRETLSAEVAAALMTTGEDSVLHALLRNKGAQLHEDNLRTLLPRLERNETLLEALVVRGGLSLEFAEKLFAVASERLRHELVVRYHLSVHAAENISSDAREWATLGMITPALQGNEVEDMVRRMHVSGTLTQSIIIRSLCIGDLRFFEAAMATLAKIPVLNARLLLIDPGKLGFQALYDKSGLPQDFRDAVGALYEIAMEETGFGRFYRQDFRQAVVQRLVNEQGRNEIENLPYLIELIRSKETHHVTVH